MDFLKFKIKKFFNRFVKYRRWTGVSVTIIDGHVEVWIIDGLEKRLMIQEFYGGDGCVVDHYASLFYWSEKPVKGRWCE